MARKSKTVFRLTGDRRDRHYLIMVDDVEVCLPHAILSAFCELLVGRVRNTRGFVTISRMTTYRLRKTINDQFGRALEHLIETGADEEYRLRDGIVSVTVEESFAELREKHLVSPSDMDILLESYRTKKSHAKVDRDFTGS